MEIVVSPLCADPFAHRGIYPEPSGDQLPERFRYLEPGAAASLVQLERDFPGCFYFSDMFRSASGSLAAVQAGRGAQPPGFSRHGYGGAIDLDVERTLAHLGWTYSKLLGEMHDREWYCHRRDGMPGHEGWHFNWMPGAAARARYYAHVTADPATWALATEARILELYGAQMALDQVAVQRALADARAGGFYQGAIDGLHGPGTRAALRAFQRAFLCRETGEADARTQRVLAFVTAAVKVTPIALD